MTFMVHESSSTGGRSAVVAAVTAQAAAVIPFAMFGTMAVSIRRDLGFDERMLGVLMAASFTSAGLSAVFAGRIVERVGPFVGVRLAAALASAGMLGLALIARTLLSAIPFLLLIGLSIAVVQPATDSLVTTYVPRGRQGMAFALKQTAGGPGMGLLAGLAVPLVGATLGWRPAFAIAATGGVAVFMMRPADRPVTAGRARVRASGSAPIVARGRVPKRQIRVLTLAGFFGTIAQNSFITFAVSAGVAAGVTESAAALVFALGSALGIGVRLAGGRFADRRPDHLHVGIAVLLAVSIGGFGVLAIGTPVAIVIAVPLLCSTVWGWPGLYFLAVVRSSPGAPARASGIALAGVMAGGVIGPLAFGVIAVQSYALGWALLASCSIVSALAILVAHRLDGDVDGDEVALLRPGLAT